MAALRRPGAHQRYADARRDLRRQKTSVQERSSQTRAPSLQNCASGPPKNPYAMRRYRRRPTRSNHSNMSATSSLCWLAAAIGIAPQGVIIASEFTGMISDAIADADQRDVHPIVGRPGAGFRLNGPAPKRWVWKLDGRQGYRNILQVEVATRLIQPPAAHGLKNDVSRLTIAALRFAGLHAKETELDRCRAAAHTKLDPAAADLIEHADFFEGAQRMVQV